MKASTLHFTSWLVVEYKKKHNKTSEFLLCSHIMILQLLQGLSVWPYFDDTSWFFNICRNLEDQILGLNNGSDNSIIHLSRESTHTLQFSARWSVPVLSCNWVRNNDQIHFIHARKRDILWIRTWIKFPLLIFPFFTQLTLTLEIYS